MLIMHNYAANRKFKMSAILVCNIWLQRTRRAIYWRDFRHARRSVIFDDKQQQSAFYNNSCL